MLYLNHNKFEGSLDFTRLPETLEDLQLGANSFSGEIDIAHLPASVTYLGVWNNRLGGNHLSDVTPTGVGTSRSQSQYF